MDAIKINEAASEKAKELAELRTRTRYQIAEKRIWRVRVEDKNFPIDWVQDLSASGMKLRQGQFQGFHEGQVIKVELEFMGSSFAEVSAEVKWLRADSNSLNMNVFGIEFQDPKGRFLRKWKKRKMGRFLEKAEDKREKKEEELRLGQPYLPSLQLETYHITISLLLSFAAGLGFSMFT